ncbi:DedA family protein [Priestia koreensis]|uniref:DedA family protein n=1 Tax=Priestia koreensis TaxID=284581 RepID=UPI003019DDD0
MPHLLSALQHHSYLILFLGIFLGVLAVPVSGELLMGYAGYLVYQEKMNYIFALCLVYLATGIGVSLTFWIGKTVGYTFFEKYGKYIGFSPEKLRKSMSWFDRSGSALLLFVYFIPGVRHFTGYVYGISARSYRRFIIPSFIGLFLWTTTFITLGKIMGPQWESIQKIAGSYMIEIVFIIIAIVALFLAYRIFNEHLKALCRNVVKYVFYLLTILKERDTLFVLFILSMIGILLLATGIT